MRHTATESFWATYYRLPQAVRAVADENFELLKDNPRHPSLHLKKVGSYWSVRAGLKYRALGVREGDVLVWFWIGSHAEYDRLIS